MAMPYLVYFCISVFAFICCSFVFIVCSKTFFELGEKGETDKKEREIGHYRGKKRLLWMCANR
jgi:hypothetical protein